MVVSAMEMLIGGVCEEDSVPSGGKTCKSVSASVLLRKLRWSTLGLQFDCITTNYLIRITRSLMNSVSWLRKWLLLQCPCEKNFSQKEIHSGGHLDDMEADWSKPIVSMRYLGNSLFYHFLQRFQPKEEACLARIFSNKENTEIATLESHFCDEKDFLEFIRTSRININIRQVF
ncbi:hypothetical protein POTOM_004013 [Populus tomentosa]|uniref:Uncharacterized protein n=1 Tax=Populus tomentosa TaxID=118781 RepID=A0A8X8AJI5_POPTO|nr:hypothetical protein POTOM_004013 [Populus tomentosa]